MNKQVNMHRIWGVCFIIIIVSVSAVHIWVKDTAYSAVEKRNLTTADDLKRNFGSEVIPVEEVEEYLADQFPSRDIMIRLKSTLDRMLGRIKFMDVYVCGNEYLMQDFGKPDPENMSETYEQMRNFAERYPESSMYMMLVPNAISVYKKYLPDYVHPESQNDFIADTYEAVSGNIEGIDIAGIFAGMDKRGDATQLYYYTDHHWTTDAAYIAYKAFAMQLRFDTDADFESGIICNDFEGSLAARSGLKPSVSDSIKVYYPSGTSEKIYYRVLYEDEQRTEGTCYAMDRLDGDNPYEVFFGGNHSSVDIITSADTARTLLIFKDSYANCFVPFLIPHYSKIKIIDPRYYYDDIDITMQVDNYTDILFLYNVNTFSQDTSLKAVLQNEQYD